mgnify:FL=1
MVVNYKAPKTQTKILLVDIGGTNVRTCKAILGSDELINPHKENTNCLKSFDELIQKFLDEDSQIKHIVFSVAGPKINQAISMTNRDFKIDKNEILKTFNLESCHVLNDWESIGYSLALFDKNDMHVINKGKQFNNTALMIGPGTGLGAALVVNNDIVLPTEIGNSCFSINSLMAQTELSNSNDFVVIEDLISGGGISNIFRHFSGEDKTPELILESYHKNATAKHAIDQFSICLSQVLSELAMTYMPGRGIFLAGGLMRSLVKHLDINEFTSNFLINRKPMHADVLREIPISLVTREMTCLHGNLNYINNLNLRSII